MIDAAAVIAALRDTDARSGGRREAWTREWSAERDRLDALARERAGTAGLLIERDAFANTWYVLPGELDGTVLVHSHSDCVPGGGWLDGILGVQAGIAALAATAADAGAGPGPDRPRRTLAVVDWADEEGTRFGRSLLGSAAATGALTAAELGRLRSADGEPAGDVVAAHGFDPAALGTPSRRLADVVAAVELHIEQGPALEHEGAPAAAVAGCLGVRRRRIVFRGRAGHAGTIAMADRHDPARAAAAFITEITGSAERAGGLATTGEIVTEPAFITAVPAECRVSLDLRHGDGDALESLDAHTTALLDQSRVRADWTEVYREAPVDFDPTLIAAAERVTGRRGALRSGALHDSASLARAGVATVMLFAPSIGGVSHARAEDTTEVDLAVAIEALGALVHDLLTS